MRHLLLLAACGFLAACSSSHEEGHGHAHEEDAHDHGHGHEAEDERPAVVVTTYADGLELFMEYPALVVGQPSALVAHFTDARNPEGFVAVTKGRVIATLRYADGSEERFVAEELLRDGIFKPVVTPGKPGAATLTLALEGPQVAGRVPAGSVIVHPSTSAAIAAAPPATTGEATVPYLKEQQWKTTFATAPVEKRLLRDGIRANGELRPVAGKAAELAAPVAGRVVVPASVPHLGMRVRRGDRLFSIVPIETGGRDRAGLDLAAAQARAELGLAEREVRRAEELLAVQAIPEKQLDAARVAENVARARLQAAERQLSLYRSAQGGGGRGGGSASFELRAPLDGVVSFADVMPGAIVEPGQLLVSVVDTDRLWLEARVFESDAPRVQQSPGATFTVAGIGRDFVVDETEGTRVAVGAVVDPATRTVPVIFELPNPGGMLKPGMFAKVRLLTGEGSEVLAIPAAAVVDDRGRPTVYVMEGGESFFERKVELGARDGGWVEVRAGLREGERVVSRGAYELKLANASGAIPEHGHQH